MENILSKGHKNLIFGALIFIVLVIVLLAFFSIHHKSDINYSFKIIKDNIHSAELSLNIKVKKFIKRAVAVKKKYNEKTLLHSDLKMEEALIETENGIIKNYKGAIYYFKYTNLLIGKWKFIKQDNNVYFVYKTGENRFFVRFFCNIIKNNLLKKIKIPTLLKEIKFISNGSIKKNSVFFNKIKDKEIYYIEKILKHTNNQFLLYLKFSKKDFFVFSKRQDSFLISFIIILIISFIWILGFYFSKTYTRFFKEKKYIQKYLIFFLYVFLFYPIINIAFKLKTNDLDISILGFEFSSINQVFIILFIIVVIMIKLTKSFKYHVVWVILVNFLFPVILFFSFYILENSSVSIAEFMFEFGYLSLITTLFFLFLILYILLREFDLNNSINKKVIFIIVQILSFVVYVFILKLNPSLSLLFILSISSFIFLKTHNVLRQIIYVFIVATLITMIVNMSFSYLKKQFVSSNLKKIFLNQENYSKLVIGEIIEELELSGIGLTAFFDENNKNKIDDVLLNIWNHSLASKEEIASGIYVLDNNKKILNQFSYKIPYLKLEPTIELPVWTTEEADGLLYGKELSVSFGAINVSDDSKQLGYIVIQVLNSPQMILRNSGLTIFSLDKKLKKAKLNYLKIKNYKIVENPLNINLKDIVEISKTKDEWFEFTFMENKYDGYRFISGDNSIIIFSPQKNMIEWIAEIIKISSLLLILLTFISFNKIKREKLRLLYYSLSGRIFVILTLISILSIILFSIFTINYYSRTVQRGFRDRILKNGRIAQNLIGQLLSDTRELAQEDVFLVSNIINNDIHVFLENELLFSSNFKETYNLKIPKHIHSNTIEMFGSEKQSYYIEDKQDSFNLYFKVYNYIFCINYFFSEEDYNFGKHRGIDFIISLFFFFLLGSLIIVAFVRNKIMAPILFLNKKMSDVERGSLDVIKRKPKEIELKRLYSGFNSMVMGIDEQKKNVSDIARMKTIIKLGRRVAHEVKNPLTPIQLSAEQILKSIDDKKKNYDELIRKSVRYIISEADHLKKVSYGFLDLSHIDDIDKKTTDLIVLIKDQVVFFIQSYPSIHFELIENFDEIKLNIDDLKIRQLLKNVIINAIEAIDKDNGKIKITVAKNTEFVIINISDNGVGIAVSDINLLFEEDYSTKDIGTGIGLFVAKRIVELHKGKIEINSGQSNGTTVTISLPLTDDA